VPYLRGGVVKTKSAHLLDDATGSSTQEEGIERRTRSAVDDLLDHFGGIDGDLLKWVCWYGDGGLVKNLAEQRFFSSQRW
jgi:hypothetical protein